MEDVDALYQWLIEECNVPAMHRDALAKGHVDVWYRPPANLEASFDTFDITEHFIASMLGAHAVHGGTFEAHQPDDDHQQVITL